MAYRSPSSFRPPSSYFPIMRYIDVTIYTNGIIIKYVDESNHKNDYKREVLFPKHMQDEVITLIRNTQNKYINKFFVNEYHTLPIEAKAD